MASNNAVLSTITIYGGFPIFILGTCGNLLSVRLLWRSRYNPCAFIFLATSIINCIALFYGLFTRILSVGFQLDWSVSNGIWCKTRSTITQASFLVSLSCTCLASIDRFFSTCQQEKYRRLSRISIAVSAVILSIVFWLGVSVPYFIYIELLYNPTTGVTTCSVVQIQAFIVYQNYFALPVYYGFLPAIILTATGLMTYRNTKKLQQRRQREAIQKQLTSMMLLEIPIILLSTIPYVIIMEYSAVTAKMSKTPNQRSIELLLANIAMIASYITFACPFFVFFASSSSFRHDTKNLFFCRHRTVTNVNQIQPYSIENVQRLRLVPVTNS